MVQANKNQDGFAMDFDEKPMASAKTPGTFDQGLNQPGQYLDSMPASDMSADQISIQLSEEGEGDSAPQFEPADNQNGADDGANNSEEEGYADCNLSEVNYRSSVSNNRQSLPQTVLPQGATSKVQADDVQENYHSQDATVERLSSPEPTKKYNSQQRHSVLQSQNSNGKLLNGDLDQVIDRQDPLRQTASTAPFSNINGRQSQHSGRRDTEIMGIAVIQEEEEKSPRIDGKQSRNLSMTEMIKSEPQFQQKLGAGAHDRYASVKVSRFGQDEVVGEVENNQIKRKSDSDSLERSGAGKGQNAEDLRGSQNSRGELSKAIHRANSEKQRPINVELLRQAREQEVTGPVCRRFFFLFRAMGTLIMIGTLVADFAYCTKQKFSSKQLFIGCLAVLGVRCMATLIAIFRGLCGKVCSKEQNSLRALDYLDERNEDGVSANQKQAQHTRYGCLLYSTMPISYFTGSYRLINSKNFFSEKGTGIVLDFFVYALPMLFIQAINNATLYQQQYKLTGLLLELNTVQTLAVGSKLLLIGDLILEFVMFIYEMIKLHQLEKHGLQGVGRYSEQERRQKFAFKYARSSIVWLAFTLAGFFLSYFFVEQVECLDTQAVEWGRICQDCSLEHCVSCRNSSKDSCDRCAFGYFYDGTQGICEDASCRLKHCESCSESGIYSCDACRDGYYFNSLLGICKSTDCLIDNCDVCKFAGPQSCDLCIDGFKFDRETGICEDVRCRIDKCEDCSLSGISSCDKCAEGFYYDTVDLVCHDFTCKVEQCQTCDADPKVCEQCVKNYWLDTSENTCIDATCLDSNCADCSVFGPQVCNSCQEGFFMTADGACSDCNPNSELKACSKCKDEFTCLECAPGMRFENGVCNACSPACADCNQLTGVCNACKEGYFIDSKTKTCEPCKEGCLECSDKQTCSKCNINMHQLMYPEDMQCKCDLGRDWMPSAQGAWTCECKGDYLTQDGRCTTIEEAFPGCAWTYKAGELDEHRVVGLRVGKNVSNGFVDAGVYRCGACQSAMDFFDHEEGQCVACSQGINGCETCHGKTDKCYVCEHGFHLQDDGTCFDCRAYDSKCDNCHAGGCHDCVPGYALWFGGLCVDKLVF